MKTSSGNQVGVYSVPLWEFPQSLSEFNLTGGCAADILCFGDFWLEISTSMLNIYDSISMRNEETFLWWGIRRNHAFIDKKHYNEA